MVMANIVQYNDWLEEEVSDCYRLGLNGDECMRVGDHITIVSCS